MLDPDITWRVHTARGVHVRLGATEVATAVQRGAGTKVVARRVLVNGEPGILVWSANGKPRSVMVCTVAGGRIVEVQSLPDPQRLASMDLAAALTAT